MCASLAWTKDTQKRTWFSRATHNGVSCCAPYIPENGDVDDVVVVGVVARGSTDALHRQPMYIMTLSFYLFVT
jgi:hypothetical protein